MYIIFDLGTVLIVILIFVLFIVGGIASLLEFLLAHLLGCVIAFAIIGFVGGVILSIITENKFAFVSSALTMPCVVMYPLMVMIPYYVQEFRDDFIGTLLISPITFFIHACIVILLWFLHMAISVGGTGDDSGNDIGFLGNLFGGAVVAAVQTGIIALAYHLCLT